MVMTECWTRYSCCIHSKNSIDRCACTRAHTRVIP